MGIKPNPRKSRGIVVTNMTGTKWQEQLGLDMRAGFKGINDRLDMHNGRVRSNEGKIAWIMGVGAAAVTLITIYLSTL